MAYTVAAAHFYNISRPVGRGVRGESDDIMLIQYMLGETIFNGIPELDKGGASRRGGPTIFDLDARTNDEFIKKLKACVDAIGTPDGIYRPALDDAIAAFQRSCNRLGYGPLVVDGRIDPAKVGWAKPVCGNQPWNTMKALNWSLFELNREGDAYNKLAEYPSCPAMLKNQLRVKVQCSLHSSDARK